MQRYVSRLRSLLRFSKMSASILKLFVGIILMVACLYVLKYNLSSNRALRTRSLSEDTYHAWHCELNRRLLLELQREIREKDNLLRYRGKVISNLRKEVVRMNDTINQMNATLCNLTDIVTVVSNFTTRRPIQKPAVSSMPDILDGDLFKKNKIIFQRTHAPPPPTAFPPDLAQKAGECTRPCCIALKRMTDILREYMQNERDLRERVDAYERMNATEQMMRYAEVEKMKFAVMNCSQRFAHLARKKKNDKYAMYQTFVNNSFFETATVYRADPKQKYASKFHRNFDFRLAVRTGYDEIRKAVKLPAQAAELADGLVKVDELNGMEYRMSFVFNKTRSFSVTLMKAFGPYIMSGPVIETTNMKMELINVIVPVSKYSHRFQEFLRNIEIAIAHNENIFLTVIIYGPDSKNEIKNAVKAFSKKYGFPRYDILKRNRPFNRAHALHDGITRWNGYDNVLVFLCDIDVRFDVSFLQRCRRNTQLGKSVYIPVLFSLYNPEIVYGPGASYSNIPVINITKQTGVWRSFGYGMVCMYRPDYRQVRGFNLKITGWGGEDVDLYKRFYKSNITVIRAPDPGLFHVWHPKYCDPKLKKKQYEDCLGSKARYEASQRQLGILLMKTDSNTRYTINNTIQ